MKVKSLSRVRLLATPWTAAHQAPPSMGFSRQEYWSGVPLSSPKHGHNKGQKRYGPKTEAEDIKKKLPEYTDELYKKDVNDPDNQDGVITHLEPDILECKVKWTFGSITTDKGSGGDGISAKLFPILKYDAVKALHCICQQIWKT